MRSEFGDYIVYVDESGDQGTKSIDGEYPLLVLAFCIFDKSDYASDIVPKLQDLKFRYFGHDMVVLHERDIRKSIAPFSELFRTGQRERFLEDINVILRDARFSILPAVVDKRVLARNNYQVKNPYRVALDLGIRKLYLELERRTQLCRRTFVVFESRGRKEDAELRIEFANSIKESNLPLISASLQLLIADKKVNSSGLQLADMVARPIGNSTLRPTQHNRAMGIISRKIISASD